MVLGPEDLVTCGAEKGLEISLEARGRGCGLVFAGHWRGVSQRPTTPAPNHGMLAAAREGKRVLGSRVGLGSVPQGSRLEIRTTSGRCSEVLFSSRCPCGVAQTANRPRS